MAQREPTSDDESSSGPAINTPQDSSAASTTDETPKVSDVARRDGAASVDVTPTSNDMNSQGDTTKKVEGKADETSKDAEATSSGSVKDKDSKKGKEKTDDDDSDDDKKDKPVEKLDPKLVGMSVGLKQLYSGKEDDKGRFQWQTTIPEDVGKPAEDAETQKWALIIRNVKVYNDPTRVLAVHSIVVQSPLLKELLKDVLKGYPGVTVGLHRLEFGGKFEPLIHRWPQLTAAVEELREKVKAAGDAEAEAKDASRSTSPAATVAVKHEEVDASGKPVASTKPDTKVKADEQDEAPEALPIDKLDDKTRDRVKLEHAELLQKALVSEFQTLIDESLDMKAKSVMTYEYLWALFQPGSLVYTKVDAQDRVFRLRAGKYGVDRNGSPVFWLEMLYVDTDGTRFGHETLNTYLRPYTGTRTISLLPAHPLDFHAGKDDLSAKLITRGAKVEALLGTHYKAYDGVGWRLDAYNNKEKHSVKGRIICDALRWNRFNPNDSVYVNSFREDQFETQTGDSDSRSDSGWSDRYDDDDSMPYSGHFADQEEEEREPLDDEQKLICTHIVRGYALKEKLWLNLYADSISEISFNSRAFESLVLPESQKDLILGFTSSQQDYSEQYDDVISGKGRGIIILLSGPPGVGKTLTAESVAEEMKVPLFVMSAGDLGLDARYIEAKLLEIFEMVSSWKAILLLDEADVFLEERSLHEIERNKLVSIFLRVLEYYEGIMFLTTNRVETFDAAFQSRIHISLNYPELSIESRKQVWINFLKQHNVVQLSNRERGPVKKKVVKAKELMPEARKGDEKKDDGKKETGNDSEKKDSAAPTPSQDDAAPAQTAEATDGTSTKEDATAGADTVAETDDAAAKEAAEAEEKKLQHIAATQPHCITDRDIDTLSRMHMNGRQIKNVLKTAQLLASRRREGLSKKHIEQVLEVTQHLHNSTMENQRTRNSIFY